MTNLTPAPGNTQTVQLNVPQANPYNRQAVKEYIFNETGNIMMASTALQNATISESVQQVFAEVGVFFAAMTKAISTTINPLTKKPYSLYNYNAIQNVIDGSGLFVHVTEEDIEHKTTSFGANFSKDLLEGLLGLATGVGSLAFAQGMIASLGKAGLNIGAHSGSSDNKIANIFFICEYLLGMPIVSAMVVYCDAKQNQETIKIGPCFQESETHTTLKMHKDTYMFVTPKFIREYAKDLDSVTTDQDYFKFIDYLQALVETKPVITAVEQLDGALAPGNLLVGETYAILGSFLSNQDQPTKVSVAWIKEGTEKEKGASVKDAEIQENIITFSPTENKTPNAIGVFFNTGTTKKPVWQLAVSTPLVYTAKSNSTSSKPSGTSGKPS